MKTAAIIQARIGSTRQPGKVLGLLAGEPMLTRVLRRVGRAARVNELVVATTTQPADHLLVELCARLGVRCWRGSEDDVLDRYHGAARACGADVVVRITSDCPLISPAVIDAAVARFRQHQPPVDYMVTDRFPRGLDVEVFSAAALETAWREDRNAAWREHVTVFLYRHPERFRIGSLACAEDWSGLRWTVDTAEDFELARRIYEHFGHDEFEWEEVLQLLRARPEWATLNRHVTQKTVVGGEAR
ncbi:MAG: acylneuraminate cytidylyltransferase [Acidobacteria bacterium]|nr:acylneuraminate cytidylyltransferase [Acidobacteriota bacterium]